MLVKLRYLAELVALYLVEWALMVTLMCLALVLHQLFQQVKLHKLVVLLG
jgi:hypothetical protein